MDQAPNKHTTDKAANRLQLPLQQLIELAAEVRRRMLEGVSLSSALETVSIGLPAQARAALQSIVYDVIRRRAFANAAAAAHQCRAAPIFTRTRANFGSSTKRPGCSLQRTALVDTPN